MESNVFFVQLKFVRCIIPVSDRTYRLVWDPGRTFPVLDPFHQLFPIAYTCFTHVLGHNVVVLVW